MSRLLTNQIKVELGTGNIKMTSTVDTNNNKGYLGFSHQDPKVLDGSVEFAETFDPNDYPVLITFTDARSVDSLINRLKYIKKNMKL